MVLLRGLDAIAILATAMVASLVILRSCRCIRRVALLREREALLGAGFETGSQ
jgi:hypothetical protein